MLFISYLFDLKISQDNNCVAASKHVQKICLSVIIFLKQLIKKKLEIVEDLFLHHQINFLMSKVLWKGVYPAVLTPFTEDDSIDFKMFTINLQAQIDAGIDGIILAGSLGETSTLSEGEKKDLLICTKEFTQDKLPVVMNIAEQSTRDAIKAANEAEKNGADGLMLLPPMRYKADDSETVEYFKIIAANTSLPIMIYNNPVDYKILVTLDMFEELAAISNIEAVKESTRDVSNVTRMINRFDDRYKILWFSKSRLLPGSFKNLSLVFTRA
jgi:dihydrodipicolinate synthase/N-acetylneuraminate lyase